MHFTCFDIILLYLVTCKVECELYMWSSVIASTVESDVDLSVSFACGAVGLPVVATRRADCGDMIVPVDCRFLDAGHP